MLPRITLPADHACTIPAARADDLFARAGCAAVAAAAGPEAAAEQAAILSTFIPAAVRLAIHRYGGYGTAYDALLIRGALPLDVSMPPTPATVTPGATPEAAAAGLVLLAVMSLLGEPFTFSSLYEGRLVQHVTAVPGEEGAQTAEGSQAALESHVEDAFTSDRCDHFGLLCLRGDPAAVTLLSPARLLRLPARAEEVLRQPRFTISPDVAHDPGCQAGSPPVAVLAGPADSPEICYDAIYQRPADPADREAADALAVLSAGIWQAAARVTLQEGDLLIIDNRRVVHGRTGYAPRYDGSGRWVLRAMTCGSRPRHRRRGGLRVLPAGGGHGL